MCVPGKVYICSKRSEDVEASRCPIARLWQQHPAFASSLTPFALQDAHPCDSYREPSPEW